MGVERGYSGGGGEVGLSGEMTFELRSEKRNQGQMGPGREGKLSGRRKLRGVGEQQGSQWSWADTRKERSGGDEVRGMSDKTSQATRRTLDFLLEAASNIGGL